MAPTNASATKRADAAGASARKKTASKDVAEAAKKVKNTEEAVVRKKKRTKKDLTEADKKKLGLQREKECVLRLHQEFSSKR